MKNLKNDLIKIWNWTNTDYAMLRLFYISTGAILIDMQLVSVHYGWLLPIWAYFIYNLEKKEKARVASNKEVV